MNVFELAAKLTLDTSEYTNSITGAIGKGTKLIAEGFVAATTAGAAAVTSLAKSAIGAYAEYEQLSGGVETLFKESSDRVMEYADVAYKTAGLSANQYMETVTSFSASLLQSLGGDTDAAAEVANQAIIDMSDNANKMGTSIESIQNAYNGFAKGNFTMLDNLKLGYGGTKEEMQRLLEDATKLSGVEYDLDSFADITEAIHVIQTELDITGTTAKEASTTIQGSMDSMSAAWQNLVTGIADENQDFGVLVDNFVESVGTVADNLIPRIEIALDGVANLIETMIPIIVEKVPPIILKILPKLLNAGVKIVTTLLDGIRSNMDTILEVAMELIEILGSAFIDNLPLILDIGLELIIALMNGITEALPELIPAITDAIIYIAQMLTAPENFAAFTEAALALIMALGTALIEALPVLVESIPQIIDNIKTILIENVPKIIEVGEKLLSMLAETISNMVEPYLRPAIEAIKTFFTETIPEAVNTLIEWLEQIPAWFMSLPEKTAYAVGLVLGTIAKWIVDMALAIEEIAPSVIDAIVTFFEELPDKVWTWLVEVVTNIGTWISDMATKIAEALPGVIDDFINFWKDLPDKMLEIGGYIVEGLWQGIQDAWDTLVDGVTGLLGSLISGVEDALGVASPSKVFKAIGRWTALGFGVGWEDEFKDVKQGILDDMDFSTSDIGGVNIDGEGGTGTGNIYQTINVNQQIATPDELAREIRLESRYGLMGGVALG